ncbi:hypothetical protein RN001_000738 [Aquatica leii]|uniref:Microsomal glutathione S-transferase 1 n=1 Tax=Aquatica leii TaxID=1421715 RepID=A0AAN7Q7D8_9COLE|nr:hypothetical protein RN001_000738 [Aquatica leii]
MAVLNMSLENPVFTCYLTYICILTLKMMLMSILTGMQRKKHQVLASPEDAKLSPGKNFKKSHEDVDRVRRAHLNDLENIPIFMAVGYVYAMTNPSLTTAAMLFRIYTAARCIHTYVYAIHVVPQPARGIAWGIGFLIAGYMAVASICHFAQF